MRSWLRQEPVLVTGLLAMLTDLADLAQSGHLTAHAALGAGIASATLALRCFTSPAREIGV